MDVLREIANLRGPRGTLLEHSPVADPHSNGFIERRLKKRPHRGELLPFGAAVLFRVAEKVPGGVMTERWHLGTWLGKRFHTEEHVVARKGSGLVIRSRAVKAMPDDNEGIVGLNVSVGPPREF